MFSSIKNMFKTLFGVNAETVDDIDKVDNPNMTTPVVIKPAKKKTKTTKKAKIKKPKAE